LLIITANFPVIAQRDERKNRNQEIRRGMSQVNPQKKLQANLRFANEGDRNDN